MVSGSISLPSPGFFSPFPHGTASLSVVTEYLAFDRGRPRFRQDSSCPAVLRYRPTESPLCRLRGFHPLCQAFPKPFRYNEDLPLRPLQADSPTTSTQHLKCLNLLHKPLSLLKHFRCWVDLGSSDFARRYFRNHYCFLFPGY